MGKGREVGPGQPQHMGDEPVGIPSRERFKPLEQETFELYTEYFLHNGYEEYTGAGVLPEQYDAFTTITIIGIKGPNGQERRFVQDDVCLPPADMRESILVQHFRRTPPLEAGERPRWLQFRPGS